MTTSLSLMEMAPSKLHECLKKTYIFQSLVESSEPTDISELESINARTASPIHEDVAPSSLCSPSLHAFKEQTIDASPTSSPVRLETCSRCLQEFWLNGKRQRCVFHAGPSRSDSCGRKVWTCCSKSKGCRQNDFHVFCRPLDYRHYINTEKPNGKADFRSKKVYALDVEMVFTTNGMEAARVSMVDFGGRIVLDTFVLPKYPIIDYNSRFSGVYPENMEEAISFTECQKAFTDLVNQETIIVGHAIDNDLAALEVVHGNVIDTGVLFEKVDATGHFRKTTSLKELARDLLGKTIQENASGHCSVEDATTCVELLKLHYLTKQCF